MKIDDLEVIKRLIAQTENEQVEFKETTGQLERGMETLCAFLNGEGGTVLFGVTDKGKMIGQDVADATKRGIADAINRLEPTATVQVSYISLPDNNKKIIALSAENSSLNRPFCYKGRPYYRVESVTTIMPQVTYNQMLMVRDEAKCRWELFENTKLSVEDMDDNEILKTVRLGIECGRLPENTGLSGITEGLEREEHLSIPYKAIREGVINALCHRQFQSPGGSVGIAIYDDRVEIENPGVFPRDWDIEKMKSEHCSEPRNPLIANVLYKRKLLENWGRGISLMTEECQKANLMEPEFKLSNGFVILVFRYPNKHHISTTQVPHKHHISNIQVDSLMNVVEYNTYSVKEMMALLKLKNRSYFSKEYLKPAVEMGMLEPIYPDQPRSPKQKYRLTEKGKATLKKG